MILLALVVLLASATKLGQTTVARRSYKTAK